MNPITAAKELIDHIGLSIQNAELNICSRTDWATQPYEEHHLISLTLRHDKLTAAQRQRIKRLCKLEVPAWAAESSHKPLEGKCSYAPAQDGDLRIDVEFTVTGAFICERVGEEEVEPDQRAQSQADAFAAMTPEEALEHVCKLADDLRKPTMKPRYRCEPK